MKIKIKTQKGETLAELNDSKTAKKIYESLPVKARANLWGKEIYFKIPVKMSSENARQDMEIGDIAYWPEGNAFCIFFGKTPASIDNKPRAISPVNFLGKLKSVEIFEKVKEDESIIIKSVRCKWA